jgi:hypothetical protein
MVTNQFEQCIRECYACATACDTCAAACLEEPNVQEMVGCIRLDLDCVRSAAARRA